MTSLRVGRALARFVHDNFCAKGNWSRFCQELGDKMAVFSPEGSGSVYSKQCTVYSPEGSGAVGSVQ